MCLVSFLKIEIILKVKIVPITASIPCLKKAMCDTSLNKSLNYSDFNYRVAQICSITERLSLYITSVLGSVLHRAKSIIKNLMFNLTSVYILYGYNC